MSHIKTIVTYPKITAIISRVGGDLAAVKDGTQKATAVVNYISPFVFMTELPTAVVFGVWDGGDTLWDVDGGGLPQSRWDIGL